MAGLSLLLLVSRDYSYGTAGLAVSSSAIGQGLTAPLRGRLIDRRSPRPVLLGCLAVHLTATVLLLLTASGGACPAAAVCVLAAAMGATAPPVAVMMRSLWHGGAMDAGTLATAMALDSSMTGTALITGPVLAGWLSLSLSPFAPFAAISLISTVSVIAVPTLTTTSGIGTTSAAGTAAPSATSPSAAPRPGRSRPRLSRPGRSRPRLGPLASAPLRRLLATNGLFVAAVTALDVVLPIYAREYDAAGLTGSYLGVLSVGSVLGSLALGAAPTLLSRGPRIPVLLCVFAAGSAALALTARFSPLAVLLVCPLAGLVIGALFAALRTMGGDLAQEGRVTETMSWLNSLDMAGGAAGAAVFAQVADAEGSTTALALIPALTVLAAVVGRSPRTRGWRVHDRRRSMRRSPG
ncbi:MFS transporter [Streptomyces sp. MST-110588]|nr:MFS transporter [Streptomyces sp. MST-110588]